MRANHKHVMSLDLNFGLFPDRYFSPLVRQGRSRCQYVLIPGHVGKYSQCQYVFDPRPRGESFAMPMVLIDPVTMHSCQTQVQTHVQIAMAGGL